ncbi:hypothetical protein OE88DRAFT_1278603 [Heliocybe sulcata]|uniref:Uncharacterized protein n=1 Tax=Heliocybe sulcata TaxID=5364 RepID=A0A5C3NCR1_9AGAM|nr:hypothetical protein OE88DRAFT_1278603 [Heliocybe sulcata]
MRNSRERGEYFGITRTYQMRQYSGRCRRSSNMWRLQSWRCAALLTAASTLSRPLPPHSRFLSSYHLMRIASALTLLVAGAGLAIEQVSASPIRVVIVTSHQELSASGPAALRIGHAAANAHPEIAMVKRPSFTPNFTNVEVAAEKNKGHQRLCGKIRQKAIAMSNGIRKMFGMPLIENAPAHVHKQHHPIKPVQKEGEFKIMGWVSGEVNHNLETPKDGEVRVLEHKVTRPHHIGMKCRKATFLRRIHRALMTLGPWEGRAVAFVLGKRSPVKSLVASY